LSLLTLYRTPPRSPTAGSLLLGTLRSPAASLTSGLAAHWTLNEGAGLLRQDSLNPGTGPAAQFVRASAEFLSRPNATSATLTPGAGNFTAYVQFYLDTTGNQMDLIGRSNSTGNQREWVFFVRTDRRMQLNASTLGTSATTTTLVTSEQLPTTPQWIAAWCWREGDLLFIQIDGGTVYQTAFTGSIFAGTADFNIGASNNGALNRMDGRIKAAAYWSGVLSQAQRNEVRAAGVGLRYDQLTGDLKTNQVSWWGLAEPPGQQRDDLHGTNHLSVNPAGGVSIAQGPQGNALGATSGLGTAAGKIGNAAALVIASAHQLAAGDAPELRGGDSDWEWNGWVFLTAKTTDQTLLAKDSGAAGGREFNAYYDTSSDVFRWTVYDGTAAIGTVDATTFGSPTAATFYFLRVTHDAANNLVGISVNNGTLDTAATTGAPSAGTTQPLRLGAMGGATPLHHGGRQDDWAKFNRLLSAGELTSRYNGGNGRTYPFL
jgi:concanavalin A-like lectin/glucanase superfamily protein